MWVCEPARTYESQAPLPQTSKLRVSSRRQILALRLTREGGHPTGGVARTSVSQRRGQSPAARQTPCRLRGGRTGPRAPNSLCRSDEGTLARGGQGHGRDPKKCGRGAGVEGGAPHSRRSAEGKKKKRRKRGFSGPTPRV